MGEYASTLNNQKKMNKIIEHLCLAGYRACEDENTRVYIINAITKLHGSLNFEENDNIRAVMTDYLKSKHVDVQ